MLGTGKSFRTARDADTDSRPGAIVARSCAAMPPCAQVVSSSPARSPSVPRAARARATRSTDSACATRATSATCASSRSCPADLQLGKRRAGRAPRVPQRRARAERAALLSRARAISQSAAAEERAAARHDRAPMRICSRSTIARCRGGHADRAARGTPSSAALAQHARIAHARFAGRRAARGRVRAERALSTRRRRDAVAAALDRAPARGPPMRSARARLRSPARIATTSRLELDGSPLAAYGSQGQQRTAVLALKVAEYAVMRERCERSAAAAARRRALRAGRRPRRGVPRRRRRRTSRPS